MKTDEKISKITCRKNLRTGTGIFLFSVLGEGLEPSRTEVHRILSPVRLPIPPSEHGYVIKKEYKINYNFNFFKIFLKKFVAEMDVNYLFNQLNYLTYKNVY